MESEPSRAGRARFRAGDDRLEIVIPAARRIVGTLFLAVWLGAWAFGEALAIGLLLGGAGGSSLFPLLWFGAWTLGGLVTLAAFVWTLAGREAVTVTPRELRVVRAMPLLRRGWSYDAGAVRDLRARPPLPGGSSRRRGVPAILSGRDLGSVAFDHGSGTAGFGIDLGEREAAELAATVERWLADARGDRR